MDAKQTTYVSLCELFPQIDIRIIRATALDHGDDIESAVDFLVNEVLICDEESQPLQIIDAPPTVPVNSMQDSICDCSAPERSSANLACEIVQPSGIKNHKPEYECTGSLNSASNLVWKEGKSDETNTQEQEESIVWLPMNCSSVSEGDTAYRTNQDNIDQDSLPVSWNQGVGSLNLFGNETEDQRCTVSMGEHEAYPIRDLSCFGKIKGDLHSVTQSPVHHGTNLSLSSKQEVDTELSLIGKITNEDYQGDDVLERNSQPIEHYGCDECGTSLGTMDYLSYDANIETLDEFVQDSSNDKMHLSSVMEEICLLQLQVEKEQVNAQVAKADAAKGGLDTLMKVEEMRKTLARAWESNRMHAGEIYGEKSVLATESREFRSRLLQLKADQGKLVSYLNELRAAIQTQFDLATKERVAAEEEKNIKEAIAREVLAMEEALLAKVAQESRNLEAEAEICTTLRKCLVDRGSIVDSLQGEMAVLLEDVETLKKQMEEGTLSSNRFCKRSLRSNADSCYWN